MIEFQYDRIIFTTRFTGLAAQVFSDEQSVAFTGSFLTSPVHCLVVMEVFSLSR